MELYQQEGFTTPEAHVGTYRRMDSHAELDAYTTGEALWASIRWRGQTYVQVAPADPSKLAWLHDPDLAPPGVRGGWVGA